MKTIAQELNIKVFPFEIKDAKGNKIYHEDSKGFWIKREFDSNGNVIHYETSRGYWSKSEYDSNGNRIYFENSDGILHDNRPKEVVEMTMEEVNKALGKNVKIIEG